MNSQVFLDDPQTTLIHAKTIKEKTFLRNIYTDFYNQFKESIKNPEKKKLVELGSGGGFIKDIIPNVTTSEIMKIPTVDMHFSALKIPFKNNSIYAFFMIDVLHHLPDAREFFIEAQRTLKRDGIIVMIEPANTVWARFIYKHFHHEPFDTKGSWKFDSTGQLSGANGALPWIIFKRDREKFKKFFPRLKIIEIKAHIPFRYILSGGLSFPQLIPSFTYPLILKFEKLISPLNPWLGMFYTIKIKKK